MGKLRKYIRRWKRDAVRPLRHDVGVDQDLDPTAYDTVLNGGHSPVPHFHSLLEKFHTLYDTGTNGEQRAAYRDAELYISGVMDVKEQLVMFSTGGGGTGKSQVIRLLVMAAVLAHGPRLDTNQTKRVMCRNGASRQFPAKIANCRVFCFPGPITS